MSAGGSLARGITRNVVVLGLVSLLTDVSSELLVYVIPLFLVNVLAATPTAIGIIEGTAEAVAAFVKLASGAISDRSRRRKPLVAAGYGTSVVSKALYVFAAAWPVVLVARVGDRIGKGIRTAPRDALIADSTPAASRGRAFGLHRAMDTAGAVVGVGLAAVVIELAQGDASTLAAETFRLLALVALVPGVLALVVIAVGVRDVPTAPRTAPVPPLVRPGLRQRAAAFPRAYWVYVAAVGLFTLGNSSDAFIAIRSQALGVTVRDLMLVIIAFNIVNSLVAWPAGGLSDRIGRRGLLAVAWGIYAVAYAGFALASAPVHVLPLWLLYGAYYGVNEAVGRALVADLAAPHLRATAFGILNAVVGLAILPASIIAGLAWDRIGQPAPFWFGALCATAAIVLLAFVRRPARGAE
ncbi:MAG TPA: MFS transporter [Patescibacteria group bacterium]|nr:MFS transporter [Patescibacteria group bacterium]